MRVRCVQVRQSSAGSPEQLDEDRDRDEEARPECPCTRAVNRPQTVY